MIDYSGETLRQFLNKLASSSPAPGGGAAAALTAATGLALLEMTVRINAARAPKGPSSGALLQSKRAALLKLSASDAEAFLKLSGLKKIRKESAAYQKALKRCAQVPLAIAELSQWALGASRSEAPRTSRWLASDLAEAALFLEAALQAGRLNVEINLKGMVDKKFVSKTRARLDALQKKAAADRKALMKALAIQ